MSKFIRLSISELGLEAGSIVDLTDEVSKPEERDSGWYPNQKMDIGDYELTEWRSDRNHLDLELQFHLKQGTSYQTAQMILLTAYVAFMGE